MKLLGIVFCAFFVLAFGNSISKRTGLTTGDFEFSIYDHPSCSLYACATSILDQGMKQKKQELVEGAFAFVGNLYLCKDVLAWRGVDVNENTISICAYTGTTVLFNEQIRKGSAGIMGCFFDYFFDGYRALLSQQSSPSTTPTYYTGLTAHGAHSFGFFDDTMNWLLNEGDTLTVTSMLSVSTKLEKTCQFAARGGPSNYVFLFVKPLKKSVAVDVAEYSIYPPEDELIYPPNIKFKVTKIEKIEKDTLCNGTKYDLKSGYIVHIDELETPVNYKKSGKDPEYDEYKDSEKVCRSSFLKLSISLSSVLAILTIAVLI